MTKPTAEPAAKTVFDQRTFSAVSGDTVGGNGWSGTDSDEGFLVDNAGGGLFSVKVPIKE